MKIKINKLKRNILPIILSFCALFALQAQDFKLPAASPLTKIKQTIGVTEIKISYSSPGVKGRKIFGKLVKLDELWRTGANKNTTIEFSESVVINETNVPAGKYSIFTIPSGSEWTFILNSGTEYWGTGSYDESKDVLRVNLPVLKAIKRERLLITMADFTETEGNLSISWDNIEIAVPIKFDSNNLAVRNIDENEKKSAGRYLASARYFLERKAYLERGVEFVELALDIVQDNWYYYWIAANLYKEIGDLKSAKKHLKKSHTLGSTAENFFYRSQVESALNSW